MSDKQHPDDPRFDWLYPGGGKAPGDGSSDPEATQVFQPGGRPDNPRDDDRQPPEEGPEHTQVLGVPPAGQERPGDAPPPKGSFGGTYGPPSRSEETRFVPPSQPGPGPGPGPGLGGPPGPPLRPAGAAKPPKRPRRRRNWWLRGILLLLLLWVAFLVFVPIWSYSKISKVEAEPSGDRPEDTSGTTYLLVGSDAREGVSGGRTDTILMLHVPSGGGPNLLLSIPRDSFVEIPGEGENKINAAYAFGGPPLLVETVEQNTGIHVDNYVEIGFTGFVELVDAVGGIEVCPEERIDDPKAGNLKLDAGCQEIDGEQALGYSRSRAFSKGDITRAEHQREVIAAVGSEAVNWRSVVFPWRYWSLNTAAADTLRVGENVGPIDLARFAWAMSRTGGEDAKRCVVPYTSLATSTSAGSAVIWDEEKAQAVFDSVRADDTESIECSPR